jgi:CheY-like chemotaxis protein
MDYIVSINLGIMNKQWPIIVIEDDIDDIEIYKDVFREIDHTNELVYIKTSREALEYLRKLDTKPFLILADGNMPVMNGFELREAISKEPELNEKCIPYILISTDVSPYVIKQAYMLSVQGIFKKPASYKDWKQMISDVVNYWKLCMSPYV